MTDLNPAITKKMLYNQCLNDQIIAFTYDLARSSDQKSKFIFFKILPMKNANLKRMFDMNYVKPQEIKQDLAAVVTTYIPRVVEVVLTCNQQQQCPQCEGPTYQEQKYCLNQDCSLNSYSSIDLYQYVQLGRVRLSVEDLSYKESGVECAKCKSCKICKKIGKKCMKHKTCEHNKDKTFYHLLNSMKTTTSYMSTSKE